MNIKTVSLIVGLAMIAISPQVFSEAQEKSGVSAVDLAHLAKSVAKIGLDSKDPVLLAAAATLQKQVEAAKQDTKFEADETNSADTKSTKAATFKFTADNLFAEAKKYSEGVTLNDAIERTQNTKSRGALGGVKYTSSRVNATSRDLYRVAFKANETAKVLVSGDGDTDLDLYIHDENGNATCKDVDDTDTMYCEWVPRWTGTFRIEIRNLGSVYNAYELVTN